MSYPNDVIQDANPNVGAKRRLEDYGGLNGTASTIRDRESIGQQIEELAKKLRDIQSFLEDALTPNLNPILVPLHETEPGEDPNKPIQQDSDMFQMIRGLNQLAARIRENLSTIQRRVQL